MPISHLTSLRTLLIVDAATCCAMGAVLTLGAGAVAGLTQIPPGLLFYAGLSLFPIAAFMVLVALWAAMPPAAGWLVVLGNVLWVLGSLALLVSGWVVPNSVGTVFIIAQALVVALLAKLEYDALRQDRPPAHAI